MPNKPRLAKVLRHEPVAVPEMVAAKRSKTFLILDEHMGVTQAYVQVGDDSAAQFNHEYSRLFGAPPKQEIQATWHKGAGSVSHRIGWIANLASSLSD